MLFDSHLHFSSELDLDASVDYYRNFFKKYGIDKATVLAYCQDGDDDFPISNYKAIWLKKVMAPDMYAYMALLHDFAKPRTAKEYLSQLEDGMAMGFDGWKQLDGKPNSRKRLGMSLADERFDLAYEKAEKTGFPIVYHVADPEYFWYTPDAYCYYGDGSYLEKEQLYTEIEEILKKFPTLKITFAHFYFMSENIDRAAKFLDDHPTVSFDITPGREMFHGFSKNIPAWREFFKTYKERIIWGSDLSNTMVNDGYNNDVYTLLNKVLTEGEKFWVIDGEFTPLGIDNDVLGYIRYKNQLKISGNAPKTLNEDAIRSSIEKFLKAPPALSKRDKEELTRIAHDFGMEI